MEDSSLIGVSGDIPGQLEKLIGLMQGVGLIGDNLAWAGGRQLCG
jgi:hypothetical protein